MWGDVGNKANKSPVDSEELADLKDSLAPIYDQLELTRFWWIAEYVSFKKRYQEVNKKSQLCPEVEKIPMCKGNKRDFVRVHRSVKTRMEARCCNRDKYVPWVVDFEEERVVWVD